jgi:hypothetical protein
MLVSSPLSSVADLEHRYGATSSIRVQHRNGISGQLTVLQRDGEGHDHRDGARLQSAETAERSTHVSRRLAALR